MKLLAIAALSLALLASFVAPAASDALPATAVHPRRAIEHGRRRCYAREIDALPHFVGAGEPQNDVRYRYMHGPEREENGALEWIPLQPDRRDGKFGPELTFAREVKEHSAGPVAIVKSAWGARPWRRTGIPKVPPTRSSTRGSCAWSMAP